MVERGTSTSKDDRDFFVFTPAQGGTLTGTVPSTGGLTAQQEIETAAGLKVLETDPNNGVNSRSAVVQGRTSYFVRLRSPDRASAAYEVELRIASPRLFEV